MIIEVVPRIGGQPLRIDVSQFVLRGSAGTPLLVAGEFGPPGGVRLAVYSDDDFAAVCRAFGYDGTVSVTTMSLPRPPDGARLLTG